MRGSAWLGAVIVAALLTTACTLGPTPTPPSTARPTPTPVPGASLSGTGPPGQTDTAWGRIWDGIPASFPLPAGSTPTIVGGSAASATVQIPAAVGDAHAAARWFADAFDREGRVWMLEGPIEDGSFVVRAGTAADPCDIEVSVAPLGSTTVATILYGAGCPFE